MNKILALMRKDIKLLLRDKSGAFFVLGFPLLMAIFFGTVFSGSGGGGSKIPVAVVDEDSSEVSMAFSEKLAKDNGLDVSGTTREEAVSLVQKGKRTAYLVLSEGFDANSKELFWGEPTRIEIGIDPSRKAEAAMLRGILTGHFMQNMMGELSDPVVMRDRLHKNLAEIKASSPDDRKELQPWEEFFVKLDTAMAQLETNVHDTSQISNQSDDTNWQPVEFEVNEVTINRDGPKNAFEITFPQALIWAMIGCSASFGISLVIERVHGTLVRLRIAPLTLRQILAGKGLACYLVIVVVSITLIIIGMVVFNVHPGSMSMLLLAIASSGVCFVGIMMLLSVLGKTEASAGGIGWSFLLVMSMIGGGMIPLMFIPSWMRILSNISPVKWVILTLEGAIWRGFSVQTMLVYSGGLILTGIVTFLIGASIFKRTVE